MAYSSSSSTASRITSRTFSAGGGSIRLSIGAGGSNYTKSLSPTSKNIFNQLFQVKDASDKSRTLIEFDTTGRGLDSGGSTYIGQITSNSLVGIEFKSSRP